MRSLQDDVPFTPAGTATSGRSRRKLESAPPASSNNGAAPNSADTRTNDGGVGPTPHSVRAGAGASANGGPADPAAAGTPAEASEPESQSGGASADDAAKAAGADDGGTMHAAETKASLVDMRWAAYVGAQATQPAEAREQCAPLHTMTPEVTRRSSEPLVRRGRVRVVMYQGGEITKNG